MGDLVRSPKAIAAGPAVPGLSPLTASSKILAPTVHDQPRAYAWHGPAWDYRRTTGEVRFAELWLSNSMRQVRLVPAYRPDPQSDPIPIEEGPAVDLMAALGGGIGGQASIMAAFATQLLTPGIGYLIGEPGEENSATWQVVSAEQLRLSNRRDEATGLPVYELKEGDEASDWRPLSPGSLPVKTWRPDPQLNYRPDSPVNGALPILRELSLLTQHVEAQATSRLAGAGMMFMDASIEFEGGWAKFIKEWLATVVNPIKDRSVPAAYAPFPVKIPLGKGEKMADKIYHLMFATPFDEQSLKLRAEAIGRLATAMDMPTRMLLGESENHWGDWHTSEQGIKLHVNPDSQIVCEGITRGYLVPGLKATQLGRERALEDGGMGRVIQLRDAPPPLYEGHEVFCWYDSSDLAQKPDISEQAREAYDRFEAAGDTYRSAAGLDSAPPDGQELERQVWLSMLRDPTLAPLALLKLGMADEDELKLIGAGASGEVVPPGAQPPPPAGEEPEPDTNGPPDQTEQPAPVRVAPPQPQAADSQALIAACDGMVHRAMEKAGNKLRQKLRRTTSAAPDCPAVAAHTTCQADAFLQLDDMLAGAWDRVPEVAARLGVNPDLLAADLDTYCRNLIRKRAPHSWELLEAYLTATEAAA